MRFLVDAQLPPALARWLEAQGFEAEHVADVGMTAAPDTAVWERAKMSRAVIITKDEDFVVLRSTKADPNPAVVWLRIGNTRRAELLRWFKPLLGQIIRGLERGEKLIEVN